MEASGENDAAREAGAMGSRAFGASTVGAAEAQVDAAEAQMETLSLTVGYKGRAFSGFAKQPGQLTVQGQLEEALELVFRRPVETTCSGRTDAGVHARGQVVSFDVSADELRNRDLYRLRRSFNALTHDDIVVHAVEKREAGFSARFDAVSREYRYFFATGGVPPIFMRDFSWYVAGSLDADAMQRAAQQLVGEHDFKSFCKAVSAVDKPTHRFVKSIDFAREQIMGEDMLVMTIVGNAFLHSMVRSIAGSLVMVGRGQRDEAWIGQALAACDRRAAGECAPAQGLVFWGVDYRGERLYIPENEAGAGDAGANEAAEQGGKA